MKKVFIFGRSGKMGQEVVRLLKTDSALRETESLSEANVFIDFSSPEGLLLALEQAKKAKLPIVSGTTGLQEEHKKALLEASKSIPVLWSPNMSMGILALTKALEALSIVQGYDFYIEEIHHIKKKDSPSGTALRLQEKLEKTLDKKIRENISIRGGGVFGEHKVLALGPEETISFKHVALNRSVFARGALRCAGWLEGKPPRLYEAGDLLK